MSVVQSESGWAEDGFDDNDAEYAFQAPWHWRLRVWIADDLARLRFWKDK